MIAVFGVASRGIYIYIYMSLSRGARRGRLLCSVETTPGLAGGDTATRKAKNGSTKGTRC